MNPPGGLKSEVKILDGGGATVHETTYDYYQNGSLKAINYDGSKVAGYSYDPVALQSQIAFFNGGSATGAYDVYSYDTSDPRNLLKAIAMHYKDAVGQSASSVIDYTDGNGHPNIDKAGNLLSMTDLAGHWTYTYDHGGRIASIVPPNPVPEQGLGGTYGYNWLGQLMNPPAEPNHLQYNQAGLPSLWPGMYSYTYKANGMPDQVLNPTGSTPLATVTYDDAGFPSSLSAMGKTTEYHWDADGTYYGHLQTAGGTEDQSILTDPATGAVLIDNTSGSTLSYVCDPWGGTVASELSDGQSVLNGDNKFDTPQSFDQFPWHHECGGSSGQLTYYHSDRAGRFQMSTASDGRMASTYVYAPNGRVASTSDPLGARIAGHTRGPGVSASIRGGSVADPRGILHLLEMAVHKLWPRSSRPSGQCNCEGQNDPFDEIGAYARQTNMANAFASAFTTDANDARNRDLHTLGLDQYSFDKPVGVEAAKYGSLKTAQMVMDLSGVGGAADLVELGLSIPAQFVAKKGVVYFLKDAAGEVKYVGRTFWPEIREIVHRYDKRFVGLTFATEDRGLSYLEQRAYEQLYIMDFGLKYGGQLINERNGISPTSPWFDPILHLVF